MSTSVFRTPDRIVFGVGAVESLGREAVRYGTPELIVTGRRAMAEAGITRRVVSILQESDIVANVFDEVEPEPDVTTVDRCRQAIREHAGEIVIGLGGGSALDVAKVAAGLASEHAPARAFLRGKPITEPGLPYIAVPTTSGTGSEMTNNGVICDREHSYKASIRHEDLVPRLALIDPAVTLPCPPLVTATSGVDALVQAVESYLSRHATPMTEAISLRAVEELVAALPDVVERGDDIELRTRAAWGSAMAGLALTNARLGVVHGMAHPIGVRFDVPHGLVCGVLLPPALDFNRPAAPQKFAVLERLMGGDPAAYARDLLAACGLPARLADYGLAPDGFETIAEESLPSGSTKANPRPVTKQDIIALLEQIA